MFILRTKSHIINFDKIESITIFNSKNSPRYQLIAYAPDYNDDFCSRYTLFEDEDKEIVEEVFTQLDRALSNDQARGYDFEYCEPIFETGHNDSRSGG